MSPLPDSDLRGIVRTVSVEAIEKRKAANYAYIGVYRNLTHRGDEWEREFSARSDRNALIQVINKAVSRLPFIERIRGGNGFGRLAIEAIEHRGTQDLTLIDKDKGILESAIKNKQYLYWKAIQAITGKIASNLIYRPDSNIYVINEDGLIKNSLVVKVSDITEQEDDPHVYQVESTRVRKGFRVKDPTELLRNRGRGPREEYEYDSGKVMGFLREQVAREIIVKSRVLTAQYLPYFVQAFQENSPLYKK